MAPARVPLVSVPVPIGRYCIWSLHRRFEADHPKTHLVGGASAPSDGRPEILARGGCSKKATQGAACWRTRKAMVLAGLFLACAPVRGGRCSPSPTCRPSKWCDDDSASRRPCIIGSVGATSWMDTEYVHFFVCVRSTLALRVRGGERCKTASSRCSVAEVAQSPRELAVV